MASWIFPDSKNIPGKLHHYPFRSLVDAVARPGSESQSQVDAAASRVPARMSEPFPDSMPAISSSPLFAPLAGSTILWAWMRRQNLPAAVSSYTPPRVLMLVMVAAGCIRYPIALDGGKGYPVGLRQGSHSWSCSSIPWTSPSPLRSRAVPIQSAHARIVMLRRIGMAVGVNCRS